MRETLAASKVVVGQFVEKYGKYYMVRWKELGNKPALKFYNEAITTAPESDAARVAEKKWPNCGQAMIKGFFCVLLSFFGLPTSCRYQSGAGHVKGSETFVRASSFE